MKLRSGVLLGAPPPSILAAPTSRTNAWEDVSDLCAACGLILDPWQEDVLRAGLAERSNGNWAARNIGVSVPRQNGKTQIIVARVLAGLFLFGEKLIQVSAQRQDTARETFLRLVEVIEAAPSLHDRVEFVAWSETREYIKLKSGQRVEFKSRTGPNSRGKSYDCLMMDEAQIITEDAWQSVYPTMSARPNPQVWLLGTPPTARDDGEVFKRFRDAGKSGKDSRTAWIEWSARPDDDFDDPETWRSANPAFGIRVDHDAVASERSVLSDDQFATERLGIWGETLREYVIPPTIWAECLDEQSKAFERLILAVDINPLRTHASVALAGLRADGLTHVELDHAAEGVDWVVEWVANRFERNPIISVVIDSKSPAASLIPELKQRKVRVTQTTTDDMANACADFFDAAISHKLRHIGQHQLTGSLNSARKRSIGDRWAWNRQTQDSDITPIVAATLAHWGVHSRKVKGGSSGRQASTGRRGFVG